MPNKVIQYTFLCIFVVTAVLTLLGLVSINGKHVLQVDYVRVLLGALILQLVSIVIAAGWIAFGIGDVEHYKWQIVYPANLRDNFEKLYIDNQKIEGFKEFYVKNKNKRQSDIQDNNIDKPQLDDFLDSLFAIKKAGIFAGRRADGEMFLIKGSSESANFGTAVLEFPNEPSLVAFRVTSEPQKGNLWHLSFGQPDRYVEYEGRINKWPGGDLDVDFSQSEGRGSWSGDLSYLGTYVGKFTLNKQLL
jgi:hypothetical protein